MVSETLGRLAFRLSRVPWLAPQGQPRAPGHRTPHRASRDPYPTRARTRRPVMSPASCAQGATARRIVFRLYYVVTQLGFVQVGGLFESVLGR